VKEGGRKGEKERGRDREKEGRKAEEGGREKRRERGKKMTFFHLKTLFLLSHSYLFLLHIFCCF
jgi:hypothetical protein